MQSKAACSFPGCTRLVVARSLCSGHYNQQRRGAPLTKLRPYRPYWWGGFTPEQFWERLETSARTFEDTSCLEWPGGTSRGGYGVLRVGSRTARAHRVAWELANGEIPTGYHVLHRCDNPRCCNPNHLFLGTHADNMADMKAKGRARSSRAGQRLTDDEVGEMRALWDGGGIRQVDLARRFGVSQAQVSRLVNRLQSVDL